MTHEAKGGTTKGGPRARRKTMGKAGRQPDGAHGAGQDMQLLHGMSVMAGAVLRQRRRRQSDF